MKWQNGYKVVREDNGKLLSSYMYDRQGGIEYLVGQPVYPVDGYGPLCVFRRLADAARYLEEIEPCGKLHCTIYSCKYRPSERAEVWDGYYKVPLQMLGVKNSDVALADAVELMKQMPDEEIVKAWPAWKGLWQKGYKVVTEDADGRLFSALYPTKNGGVEYAVGKITVPARDCGPLCVYDEFSLDEAKEYMRNMRFGKLYECEYIQSPKEFVWTPSYSCSMEIILRLSPRTSLARAVRLTKLV